MKRSVFIFSTLVAVAVGPLAARAQDAAAKPRPEEPKAAPSAAPAREDAKAAARGRTAPTEKPRRTLKMFVGEFRAVDLEKKTLTFETADGKSYTVEAQVPGLPEALDRAAQLAQILKPGDKIRMLCSVNEKEEPILIRSLHMTAPTAPMQYR
jgi:hypothetical protein